MTPGQKLSQGLTQVLLFPLEYLNMSQDEGGDYSHAGTLAIDFLGWGASGRVYKCPYYAPCDLTCIRTSNNTNRIWQSDGRVLLADGTLDYVTVLVEHDNNPPPVGSKVKQGDLLGHTGTAGNVTGDHLHLNVAKGRYAGMEQVPPNGNWQLKNSIHVYDAMYTNNTIIINGFGHNWRVYDAPVGTKEKRKFKWVIYSRKLRSKRNL